MIDKDLEKMELNFDEKTEEKTEEEKIFTSIDNKNKVSAENIDYIEKKDNLKSGDSKNSGVMDKRTNTVINHHVEFITEEATIKKTRKMRELSSKQIAHRKLAGMIFWLFILILSVLFGANSIYDFSNKINDFIDNVTSNNVEGLKAVGQFFMASMSIWEAFMFVFFIVFSSLRIGKYSIPYKRYRKSIAPEIKEKRKIRKEKRKIRKEKRKIRKEKYKARKIKRNKK